MKRIGLVHLKYLYRLVGRAIDLYAEMKEEFDSWKREKEEKEKSAVQDAVIEEVNEWK